MLASVAADLVLKSPTTGITGCCARAASGKTAAAPPRSVMNSLRLMPDMRLPCLDGSAHISSVLRTAWQVFGAEPIVLIPQTVLTTCDVRF